MIPRYRRVTSRFLANLTWSPSRSLFPLISFPPSSFTLATSVTSEIAAAAWKPQSRCGCDDPRVRRVSAALRARRHNSIFVTVDAASLSRRRSSFFHLRVHRLAVLRPSPAVRRNDVTPRRSLLLERLSGWATSRTLERKFHSKYYQRSSFFRGEFRRRARRIHPPHTSARHTCCTRSQIKESDGGIGTLELWNVNKDL